MDGKLKIILVNKREAGRRFPAIKTMKIIGATKSGNAVAVSVHGHGELPLEKLLTEFHAVGGEGGEGWTWKYPWHSAFCVIGDAFYNFCMSKGVEIAKSKDGAWAVAVRAGSVRMWDKSGVALAGTPNGANHAEWL